MPRGARRILASLLRVACAAAPLCACALDVQTIRYPEAAGVTARPEGCKVRVVDWYRVPPASCVDLGDVYVGDRGAAAFSSGGCGRKRVEREIRVAACQLGADLAMVRHLRELRTSCYQARARLLRCNAAEESAP